MPEPDLLRELAELRRRVEDLERAPRLGNTSYHEPGTWRFYDAAGVMRFQVGRAEAGEAGDVNLIYERPDGGGDSVALGALFAVIAGENQISNHGLLITQPDGTNILQSDATDPNSPFDPGVRTILRNFVGDVVLWVDNDGYAEPGIAEPWARGFDGDIVSTGSWTEVGQVLARNYYPQIYIEYMVEIESGSPTVEIRVREIDGAAEVIFGPDSVSASGFVSGTTAPATAHAFRTARYYILEARITAGTGSARVTGVAWVANNFTWT